MATLSAPTLGKLLSSVRNYLNQPSASNSFWTDQELTEYINEGVRMYFAEIVTNVEGHFTTQTDLDITSGTETVALPSDFYALRALYKKVNNGYEVLAYLNDLNRGYLTNGGGGSSVYRPGYYFRDNSIVLHPVPEFSETAGLRLEYIRFPDVMLNGGDAMSAQISPVFKQLIEMYAVYKAKVKESLVSGVDLSSLAKAQVNEIYVLFKESMSNRSKFPRYTVPFNPEGEF